MIIRFLIVFSVLITLNCISQECGGCRNKKYYRFLLLRKEGLSIDTSLVKINGIYILESRLNPINEGNSSYYYYRFFENGKVFMSCKYCSFPDSIQLHNLNYGDYGEYRIENNVLKIETFAPYSRYYLEYYEIIENEIVLKNYSSRRKRGKLKLEPATKLIFKFLKVE